MALLSPHPFYLDEVSFVFGCPGELLTPAQALLPALPLRVSVVGMDWQTLGRGSLKKTQS